MREIEFRGYSKRFSRWLIGFLIADNKIREFGIPDKEHEVLHIGQYTGLTDKNGKKIFEGDVFEEGRDEIRGVVVFENGAFKIKWYGIKTVLKEYGYDDGSWGELETQSFDMYYIDQMEVIGNIHDNPELLGGGENE